MPPARPSKWDSAAAHAAAADAERRARDLESKPYTANVRSAADAYAVNMQAARATADRARSGLDGLPRSCRHPRLPGRRERSRPAGRAATAASGSWSESAQLFRKRLRLLTPATPA